MDRDIDELFRLAGLAQSEITPYHEDSLATPVLLEKVIYLEGGSIHVCRGMACPHVIQAEDKEKLWVCNLSGLIVSNTIEASKDANWTGRNCGSADPDMCSSSAARPWKYKRDTFGDSARAYTFARNMTDDDANGTFLAPKPGCTSSDNNNKMKRAAKCISSIDTKEIERLKRLKAQTRASNSGDHKMGERLCNDAASVVRKIFAISAKTAATQPVPIDPRLESFDFVLSVGIRKYANRCRVENVRPNLSEIHDIAIFASTFSKAKRRQSKQNRTTLNGRMMVLNFRTINTLSQLIVSIWTAMVNTTHFLENSAGDSFRPFAAGIIYALKRGIRLNNNMVVVPALSMIADQLPTLRSTNVTAAARQLHASSHRGLCAVHRAIASIDAMPTEERLSVIEKLKVTSGLAKLLEDYANKYMSEK